MPLEKIIISIETILYKEVKRFTRIWSQTLLPPIVTTLLYFVIFGQFIGSQIAHIDGLSYMQFIIPGLVMMAIINGSFQNTVSSFFMSKMMKDLEEMLVSPMPAWAIVIGFVLGGVTRGMLLGVMVLITSLFFAQFSVQSFAYIIIFSLLTSVTFALLGLINGIYAKGPDGISLIPTFVLTPLTYLGGVFYSIKLLPVFWQKVSLINPVLYMVNGFRYGLLGVSDVSVLLSVAVLIGCIVVLAVWTLYLFKIGRGMQM